MAKPRVFVSSSYYDLRHLRSSLENFIESLGFDAILSEKGDIAYIPDMPLDESCYREVNNADIFVIIIGGRYGSEKSGSKPTIVKQFYERYDSITRLEYQSAREKDIPIYILIEKTVYSDYETFLRNKDNKTISYAHVDSVNIFHFIEEIIAQARNNPLQQFDRYADIEFWLREQWAGLFREMLYRTSSQKQIASLASQVNELAEINKTLKTYLEEVVSKIAPEKSASLIKSETKRLEESLELEKLRENNFFEYLRTIYGISAEFFRDALIKENSAVGFARYLTSNRNMRFFSEDVEDILRKNESARHSLNDARAILGLKPYDFSEFDSSKDVEVSAKKKSTKSTGKKDS